MKKITLSLFIGVAFAMVARGQTTNELSCGVQTYVPSSIALGVTNVIALTNSAVFKVGSSGAMTVWLSGNAASGGVGNGTASIVWTLSPDGATWLPRSTNLVCSLTANGTNTVVSATKIDLSPGWYFKLLQTEGAPADNFNNLVCQIIR